VLRKRFACAVLFLHQSCKPCSQSLHEIVILNRLCADEPRLQAERLLANFVMFAPKSVAFRAPVGAHLTERI